MQISTLRPGLLVSLSTTIQGNVKYRTTDIERERVIDDGTKRARWETEKTIIDPAEHDDAVKVRGKCRSLIVSLCSSWGAGGGMLCPLSRKDELIAAVEQAQALAADFNRQARVTRIGVYIISGEIAQDDEQAVRAINADVRRLLSDMEQGLRQFDVEQIREAANRAKQIGQMLSPDAAKRIEAAITEARSAARRIVKAGEGAAIEIDRITLDTISRARTAFLDMDESGEMVAPVAAGRAIDFEPEAIPSEASPVVARPVTVATPFLFEMD